MKITKNVLKQIIQEEIKKMINGYNSKIVEMIGGDMGFVGQGGGILAVNAINYSFQDKDEEIIDTLMPAYITGNYEPIELFDPVSTIVMADDPDEENTIEEKDLNTEAIVDYYNEDPRAFKEKVSLMVKNIEPEYKEKAIKFVKDFYRVLRQKLSEEEREKQ
jgi:DNA-binding transcriptional regulator of glucitol operon